MMEILPVPQKVLPLNITRVRKRPESSRHNAGFESRFPR